MAPEVTLPTWHAELWAQLQQRRARGSMPHALLLSGPAGVGKQLFATHLAKSLVCEAESVEQQPCGQCKACRLADAGTHPDIHWLQPEEEGKAIRIDAVRSLIGKTTLTTQARGSRVFLISPAHAMNRASSNALLKTLEEPSAASVMVLISSEPHLLPATIRSRCQDLLFKPVAAQQAGDWLREQAPQIQNQEALLALSGGAPLLALRADEEDWLNQAQQTLAQLAELKQRKVNPMQVVEAWTQRPLQPLLNDLSRISSDLVQLASGAQAQRLFMPGQGGQLQSLAKGLDLVQLFGFIDGLNGLRRQMTHNLNPQMLLEKVVIDWLALTRPGAR